MFFKNLKNERYVMDFGYVFIPKFHITHKNFSGDWSNFLHSCSLIFFSKNGILKNVKKIEKIQLDSEKSINSFGMKKERLSD